MPVFDVQHQDRAGGLVQRALLADRLPHAYIFHGPDGVGKETFARALAAVLLCHQAQRLESADGQPQLRPCGKCHDCVTAAAGTHPDLHLIYRGLIKYHDDPTVRKRKGRDLGVDVIRQFVIDKIGAKPAGGQSKVFIVREADRITPQAQNALLKTLEEPPLTTFLILLVSILDRMLPTIRSRCCLVPFGPLPDEFIVGKLVELRPDVSPERAELYARAAQGSLGLAMQHADDRLDEHNDRLIEVLLELPTRPVARSVGRLDEQAKALGARYAHREPEITQTESVRRGLKALFALAATWYRDVLHAAIDSGGSPRLEQTSGVLTRPTGLIANVGYAEKLATAARKTTPGCLVAAISQLAETESQLDANVNTKLCLDALVIRLARLAG